MKHAFYTLGFIVLLGYVLVIGKNVLLPLLLAIFLVYILTTFEKAIRKKLPKNMKKTYPLLFAVLVVLGVLGVIASITQKNVEAIVDKAPQYQEKFVTLLDFASDKWDISTQEILGKIDVAGLLSGIAQALSDIGSNIVIIFVYIGFLLVERKVFLQKVSSFFNKKKSEKKFETALENIASKTNTYLRVKAGMSLLVSVLSYIGLLIMDVDFAAFWALLIFFLNFIPVVGAIVGYAFPILTALLQFDSLGPVVIVAAILLGIQLIADNAIEPRFMGNSLDLSSISILLALVIWGSIWGVPGMILSIPMTVILKNILEQFPRSQPYAILMSQRGKL